jgi:hypothetical protein
MLIGLRGTCFFWIGESVGQFQFAVSHKPPQVLRIGRIVHVSEYDVSAIRASAVFHDRADHLCLAGPPQVVLCLSFDLVFPVIHVVAFQMIVEQGEQLLGAGRVQDINFQQISPEDRLVRIVRVYCMLPGGHNSDGQF